MIYIFSVKTMKTMPTNNSEPGRLVDFQEALSVDDLGSDVSKISRAMRSHLTSFHRRGTPELQVL